MLLKPFTLVALLLVVQSTAFQSTPGTYPSTTTVLKSSSTDDDEDSTTTHVMDRRTAVVSSVVSGASAAAAAAAAFFSKPTPANADFAPGGTLVEYEVGVQVGNPLASKSRKSDNSNVIFSQDYYYKFGTAPPFIEPGSTEFPKTMPFVLSQQRYEALKKYRERVQRGIDLVGNNIKNAIDNNTYGEIADGSAPEYSIRPMGLLANNFMASENTGTTNELLLARWYINEIYLDINNIKTANSKEEASKAYEGCVKAINSYLGLLNRVTTPKVGDKWDLL